MDALPAAMIWDMMTPMAMYPREARREIGLAPNVSGVYKVEGGTEGDVEIGWRAYPLRGKSGGDVVVMWHGNGEVCSDYDESAKKYHELGVHFVVVDFRGYGWGTPFGKCLLSRVVPDAELFAREHLDKVLEEVGVEKEGKVFFQGRSLGSGAAIGACLAHPRAAGLILDSAIANLGELPASSMMAATLGSDGMELLGKLRAEDPFNNIAKLERISVPVTVIHGTKDSIVPFSQARKLLEACQKASESRPKPSKDGKDDTTESAEGGGSGGGEEGGGGEGDGVSPTLVTIEGGDHNDLTLMAPDQYWGAIRKAVSGVE